jgi:hypothetical protein
MSGPNSFDYAIVQVVPKVERGEFINAGVIIFCRTQRFLAAKVELDKKRLVALSPDSDVETIKNHLELIPHICNGNGAIGQLSQPERFHWLVAPRSTMIQTSPVHCGLCTDPAMALEDIMQTMVR